MRLHQPHGREGKPVLIQGRLDQLPLLVNGRKGMPVLMHGRLDQPIPLRNGKLVLLHHPYLTQTPLTTQHGRSVLNVLLVPILMMGSGRISPSLRMMGSGRFSPGTQATVYHRGLKAPRPT